MALPQTKYVPVLLYHIPSLVTISNYHYSGAQVVFNSLLQPVFSRYFQGGPTSANLRSQADQATKQHST